MFGSGFWVLTCFWVWFSPFLLVEYDEMFEDYPVWLRVKSGASGAIEVTSASGNQGTML